MEDREATMLRRTAAYQFGRGAGAALLEPTADVTVERTSSGRPRQLHVDGDRLATYCTDGRFTLGVAGARRLAAVVEPPRLRAVVGEESEPFVREGRNAFAKFVREADDAIRPGDEVLVVDESDALLGVGRAELSGDGMLDFETGMAVKVREGAPVPTEGAADATGETR